MARRSAWSSMAFGTLLLLLAYPAWGQSDEPARPSYSRLLNIDALIDNHARFLARRYNLSTDQESYTQAFLHAKADQYLQNHREELFNLIDRLVDVRGGVEMSQQELVGWGQQALPLYEEAKTVIVQGNNEWRQTLTEDQRKVHDEDLRDMYSSFATTEDQLQRIVSGQMTLDEFRKGPARNVPRLGPVPTPSGPASLTPGRAAPANPLSRELPPPAPATTNQPGSAGPATPAPAKSPAPGPTKPAPAPPGATPAAPGAAGAAPDARTSHPVRGDVPAAKGDAGRPSRGATPNRAQPAPGGADFESQWEQYVREFIQRYQLDDEQTQRANSVLKECQEEARGIMNKRKTDIERLDKKLQTITESKDASGANKLKELAEINQQRTKLLEPIGAIFERKLKPKLETLPTRAQRQAAEAGGGKSAAPPGAKTDKTDRPGQPRSPVPAQKPPAPAGQPQPAPPPQQQPVPPPPPPPPPLEPPAQEPSKEAPPPAQG